MFVFAGLPIDFPEVHLAIVCAVSKMLNLKYIFTVISG
jgi:hypothetical protein